MPTYNWKCGKCEKIYEVFNSIDDCYKKPVDKCSCGADKEHIERTFLKAPAMRNDSVRGPGGLNDWTKTMSLEDQASVYLDDKDPY